MDRPRLSLPPSPERVRANSPVEFLHDFLLPSPRARDTVSFGLDDILHTAASDYEDFGPALADALPPRPSRHPISGMTSLTRYSASSIALPSRMGASTGGIAVGSPHNSVRLQSSVWEKSPPLRRVHLTVVNSASKASVLQQELSSLLQKGAIEYCSQTSNEGSSADYFSRSKEGRRLEAYSGSTAFEFFPLQREVQDADDKNHHVSGPGGGLVCHHRPKGCVFSHPGRSKTQEVPSVYLWREGLPIQGPALRPGFGAENVYEMHGCCTGPFEPPGHSCTKLSGRLAHSGSLQGASESSQGYCSRPSILLASG